ncbi:MAG TPA: isoprenylcysteine carboxylmethyltransferase family protein [Vicinamibacterales bacterium]
MLHRLARLRVSLGFLFALVALWLATPTAASLAIGGVIAIAGELIRIWAAGHLEKGREVTSSGPYAFTRHPLYLGSSVMGIGLAIASASVIVGAVVVLYLVVTLTAAIRTEEAHLTEKFGAAYPDYRSGRLAVERPFSLARAMRNREYRAVIGLAVAFAVLAFKIYLG